MKYRNNQGVGLFDKENTLQELLENGNPLPKLKEIIDFEQFRDILEPVFDNTKKKSNAGRKPFDPVFMFKVLFLQRLYGMSDPQIEYHIKDRTSFRDFLDIQSIDDVPDEKTVWKYKDALAQSGTYDELFKRFNSYLDSIGLIVNEGKIIDASFVIAPRQRNTREENKKIKEGKGEELFNDNPHKKCHNVAQSESNRNLFLLPSQSNVIEDKDIDAQWVKKHGERFYGYKDNVEICNKTKLIRNYTVCTANRHDSKETARVLTEPPKEAYGEQAWLDAGYAGMEDVVRAKHMTPIICEKGARGHPLTDEQKERNRQKSKVRSRVEHVFGFMEQTMGGLVFRGVGMVRAKANIALTNLVYNMCRLVQIKKYQPYLITIQ